jgi:predicted HicB family RNase H-like nuclease
MLSYKGYEGIITHVDDEADLITGEVVGLQDIITFQARTPAELKQAFEESVDDYLAWCAEDGREPEKPFSGQFVVRLDPALHRQAAVAAKIAGESLNAFTAKALADAVAPGRRVLMLKSSASAKRTGAKAKATERPKAGTKPMVRVRRG